MIKQLISVIFLLILPIYTLCAKEDNVLLKIQSNDKLFLLTKKDFEEYKQYEIKQNTLWTNHLTTFKGPLLSDILNDLNIKSKTLTFVAANNYKITIDTSDFYTYKIILTTHIDGKELTVRTRGPLWLMYPWGENSTLKQQSYYEKAIWQLKEITVNE